MYKELDNLLSADTSEDSWYDYGCIIAGRVRELLSKVGLPVKKVLEDFLEKIHS